jgi:hypothetical protein
MYTMIVDPGHSWLRVSTEEVVLMGLHEYISNSSRVSKDGFATYLETDVDAKLFTSIKAIGYRTDIYDEECFVRDLPPFTVDYARVFKDWLQQREVHLEGRQAIISRHRKR